MQIFFTALLVAILGFGTKPLQASVDHGQTALDFAQPGIQNLDGNWEFYPGVLWTPTEWNTEVPPRFGRIPGFWSGNAYGFGTYRLRLKIDHAPEILTLRMGAVYFAYRVWINGQEYPGRGVVKADFVSSKGVVGQNLIHFVPQTENDIIIQVASGMVSGGILQVPQIGPTATVVATDMRASIIQGFLLGTAFIMAVYQLLLFLLRKRDKSYIFLALGCIGILLRDGAFGRNFLLQSLFTDMPITVQVRIQYWGAMSITLGYFLFADTLFPKAMRRWARNLVVSLELLAMALTIVLPMMVLECAALIHFGASLLAMAVGLPGMFRQAWKRVPYARLFFGGILVFSAFGMLDIFLVSFWRGPSLSWVSVASCIFSFFQGILLAQRNAKAYQDLESEQKKNHHAYQELSKLVYPHQLMQLKAGDIVENTMPVGDARAIVLQFDIVDSSRLDSALAKAFFERVFTQANEVMSRGYDAEKLTATGFRIKEMGDGFLCSVGFPFAVPGGESPEVVALKLAEMFCAIFLAEESYLDHSVYGRLHCAIGVAEGEISGYFPKAGIKAYDLFGPGIVLATRYEAVRKNLFTQMDPTAIIIVQNRVYESISAQDRCEIGNYQVFDLKKSDFTIRNDPQASYFYFHTMESFESRKTA